MSKMLVTQALDERDFLVKKIQRKIDNSTFVDTSKPNSEKVAKNKIDKEKFNKEAVSSKDQIFDLIKRFDNIDAAITQSNANTKIDIEDVGEISVATAISLRSRIKGIGKDEGESNFEDRFANKVRMEYDAALTVSERENRNLEMRADEMRNSILGKENKAKENSSESMGVVDEYVKKNTTTLQDPIDAKKTLEDLKDNKEKLLRELDTKIKVANATTYIEV